MQRHKCDHGGFPVHDFDEPFGECAGLAHRRVDPSGEGPVISILRADDDARMSGHHSVESLEVLAIDGEHAANGLDRKSKHRVILDALVGSARIVCREDIVPQGAETFDDFEWEVFVA